MITPLQNDSSNQRGCRVMARILLLIAVLVFSHPAFGQLAPSIGYMFPPGGPPGSSTEVTLGGYDWTPDMQLFTHTDGVSLEIVGPPGQVLVPDPPYWFGKKARRAPFPLPREFRAILTIADDVSPGIVTWQVANANGASATGKLLVSDLPLIAENQSLTEKASDPHRIGSQLPVAVAGQIERIEEVDRYWFTAPHTGLVTCEVISRTLGSTFNASLQVHDEANNVVAEFVDTAGNDAEVTFAVQAGKYYWVSLHDLDFGGDRSFVYSLILTAGPRVVAAIPSIGQRGETRQVEFIGHGVASGNPQIESVYREIHFPDDERVTDFVYHLETPYGTANAFSLGISALPQLIPSQDSSPLVIQSPVAITGVIDQRYGEDRYRLIGVKNAVWFIQGIAQRINSPVDIAISITNPSGAELVRVDDSTNTTDAELYFTVPADGEYSINIADTSPSGGNRNAVYRLIVEPAKQDFTIAAAELIHVPIGGKANLVIKAHRSAGFDGAIDIKFGDLPAGISVPTDLRIAKGKDSVNVELTASVDAPASASLAVCHGQLTAELSSDSPQTAALDSPIRTIKVLVATTITPPFAIDAEGKDDVTKWPRGSTFPGVVLLERNEGFTEPIQLEMSSRQGRHRMGIRGPEVMVPADISRFYYPVYLPEWLETTRTSRMVVNGMAQVADPQGNLRFVMVRQKTRMGFLPTGALLKLSADQTQWAATPESRLAVPLLIDRSPALQGDIRLELMPSAGCSAKPQIVVAGQGKAELWIDISQELPQEQELVIRATAWQAPDFPVISESKIILIPKSNL